MSLSEPSEPPSATARYDVAIIGAGMSGLAAGIRLAHFGKRVCLLERHNAVGGLNGFYSRAGRKYDVGLHALTNYVAPGVKGTPLGKLLRQLRIEREELDLCPQKRSRVSFLGVGDLAFSNDPALLESEVARLFPAEADGFRQWIGQIRAFDDAALDAPTLSAREVFSRHLRDPLLVDMLFCPLMYYGSATEGDMEFAQAATMAKAVLLEGFARPHEGVRRILRVLLEKFRAAGGERRMKCGVRQIVSEGGRAARLILDDGRELVAEHVFSSIGGPETERLLRPPAAPSPESRLPVGALSFVETIRVLDCPPRELGWGEDTIVFFNDSPRFDYRRPSERVDPRSGVICFPNNFDYGPDRALDEGWVRLTALANHDRWVSLPEEEYQAEKGRWFETLTQSAARFLPPVESQTLSARTVATDMFTPRTIVRYTGRLGGAIYGSARKIRDGRTALSNLYLCGADQGFLGIVGALLSGITMANVHVLQARR